MGCRGVSTSCLCAPLAFDPMHIVRDPPSTRKQTLLTLIPRASGETPLRLPWPSPASRGLLCQPTARSPCPSSQPHPPPSPPPAAGSLVCAACPCARAPSPHPTSPLDVSEGTHKDADPKEVGRYGISSRHDKGTLFEDPRQGNVRVCSLA